MSGRPIPRVVRLEAIGAAIVLALLALNEYLDLPLLLFGEAPTPQRHHEFVMESVAVVALATIVIAFSWIADRRHHRLKSLLVMCSWCRKVRTGDEWTSIETFLKDRDAATPSFGLCPACYQKQASTR